MRKKKYQVITIGGATRDIIFYTQEGKIIANPQDLKRQKLLGFEYGAKIISQETCFTLGGGGCNVAVSLARLGLKTASFIRVGEDREGLAIMSDLKKEGVGTEFVQESKKCSTGFSFVVVAKKTKEHVIFLYRGANDELRLENKDLKRINTEWIHVSSLTGRNWSKTAEHIIKLVNKKGVKLSFNPGETQLKSGGQLLKKLLKYSQVLILNKDEAVELVLRGRKNHLTRKKLNQVKSLIQEIYSFGPKIVVITVGKKGAYAFEGQKLYYSPIIDVPIMDTTGAGDCFGSSFLAGIIRFKGDIKKSLKLGILNTASLLQQTGAQRGLVKWSEIKNKFR